MTEDELIAAMGGLVRPDYAFGTISDPKPGLGQVKCLTESCPVMLTIECGRVYCHWCARKLREAAAAK